MNIIRPSAYVAHTPSKKNPQWHLLTDHTFGVTALHPAEDADKPPQN